MQTNAITMNDLEWRSDAVQASAGQVLSKLARDSKAHYFVLLGIKDVNSKMLDLLEHLHANASIEVFESSRPEDLKKLGDKMHSVHSKVRILAAQIQSWDLGFWKFLYRPRMATLLRYNKELAAHADTFKAVDAPLVLLSKRDQGILIQSLSAPEKPNDALRRAFM